MAQTSSIEWTQATWNPITGCSVLSPGCKRCYAMRLAGTRLRNHPSRAGLTVETENGPVWTGEVRLNSQWLDQPLRWRKPLNIFVCAHADLFHKDVPDAWINEVFDRMEQADRHRYQVLTKRSARMRDYIRKRYVDPVGFYRNPHKHIWLGVSVEDQKRAEERIPDLIATPAPVLFLSCEPLLEGLDITPWMPRGLVEYVCQKCWSVTTNRHFNTCKRCGTEGYLTGSYYGDSNSNRQPLSWVICGGESQHGARPMHPAWARGLRDQCVVAGVPFFFKQWGEYAPAFDHIPTPAKRLQWMTVDGKLHAGPDDVDRYERKHPNCGAKLLAHVGKKGAGRILDGRTWDEFPKVAA